MAVPHIEKGPERTNAQPMATPSTLAGTVEGLVQDIAIFPLRLVKMLSAKVAAIAGLDVQNSRNKEERDVTLASARQRLNLAQEIHHSRIA